MRFLFQRVDCQLLFARPVSHACSNDNAWFLYNCFDASLSVSWWFVSIPDALLFLLRSGKPLKEDTGKASPAELQSDVPEVDDRKLTKPQREPFLRDQEHCRHRSTLQAPIKFVAFCFPFDKRLRAFTPSIHAHHLLLRLLTKSQKHTSGDILRKPSL